MAKFNIPPTIALVLDSGADIRAFAAYVPGTIVKSKFGEPIRLMQLIGHFPTRDGALVAIKDWKKK
ncbi:hypothetical protein M0Q28_06065 [Patescibacteria group bacterium]|jgi:hypothetical protein|nr:hypothetical protein [Patescibacteria group bacterium]